MPRARPGRDVGAHFLVERHQPDTVGLAQHQIREAGRELNGILGFAHARTGIRHRSADIHKQGRPQVGLFLVFLEVESVRLAEHLPVESADFVALHVLPVLAELDAEPFVRRRMQPGANAFHDLARQDLQICNLLQIGWSQKISRASHRCSLENLGR